MGLAAYIGNQIFEDKYRDQLNSPSLKEGITTFQGILNSSALAATLNPNTDPLKDLAKQADFLSEEYSKNGSPEQGLMTALFDGIKANIEANQVENKSNLQVIKFLQAHLELIKTSINTILENDLDTDLKKSISEQRIKMHVLRRCDYQSFLTLRKESQGLYQAALTTANLELQHLTAISEMINKSEINELPDYINKLSSALSKDLNNDKTSSITKSLLKNLSDTLKTLKCSKSYEVKQSLEAIESYKEKSKQFIDEQLSNINDKIESSYEKYKAQYDKEKSIVLASEKYLLEMNQGLTDLSDRINRNKKLFNKLKSPFKDTLESVTEMSLTVNDLEQQLKSQSPLTVKGNPFFDYGKKNKEIRLSAEFFTLLNKEIEKILDYAEALETIKDKMPDLLLELGHPLNFFNPKRLKSLLDNLKESLKC